MFSTCPSCSGIHCTCGTCPSHSRMCAICSVDPGVARVGAVGARSRRRNGLWVCWPAYGSAGQPMDWPHFSHLIYRLPCSYDTVIAYCRINTPRKLLIIHTSIVAYTRLKLLIYLKSSGAHGNVQKNSVTVWCSTLLVRNTASCLFVKCQQ